MVHDLSGVSTPRLKNIDARDFRKMDATKNISSSTTGNERTKKQGKHVVRKTAT